MEWKRGPTVGRGSTATVSIATASDGEVFAVKSTDFASSALLRKEESFISQLSSPHIIRCLGSDVTSEDNKSVYNLFLEYSGGGSLSDLIRNRGGALDEESIRFYSRQLLVGLEYLHRNRLVHCDIKGQNVLIGGGGGGVKIADFGCAKWAGSGGAFAGTPAYMAPEVSRGEEQSFPADVWAVGCTVVEMATGCHPWPEMKDPAAALYRIAFSGDAPEIPSWFSGNAKDFLEKCFVRDPTNRWTAAELLRHPFLDTAEESCGRVEEVTRRSPTSVTDQSFWDALEVSESIEIPAEVAPPPSDSPFSRIQALIGGGAPIAVEEEWVTVRSNGVEEWEDSNQNFGDSIEEEEFPASDSALMEDSSFNFFDGHTNCTSPLQIQCVNCFNYSEILSFDNNNNNNNLIELNFHQHQVFSMPPFRFQPLIIVHIILRIILFLLSKKTYSLRCVRMHNQTNIPTAIKFESSTKEKVDDS